jgi:hypothetical protein
MKRDFSQIRTHRFRERRYEIVWRLPKKMALCSGCGKRTEDKKSDGECDPPDSSRKAIRIGPRLSEPDLMETAIHEGLHACLWDLEECAVNDTARDIAKLLRRMGFRLG